MSMNCNGCEYDGFIMLGDKKVSYCKYFKETKRNMDRTIDVSYYPFQHGYCLHKTRGRCGYCPMKRDGVLTIVSKGGDMKTEAIKILEDYKIFDSGGMSIKEIDECKKHNEALDFAIEVLKQTENEDCISRKDAIESLDRIGSLDTEADREYARDIFRNILPATPKQLTGEWIYCNGNGECSICGREKSMGWDNYCGYCGARMRR